MARKPSTRPSRALNLFPYGNDMQRGDLAATFSDMALPRQRQADSRTPWSRKPSRTGPSNPWTPLAKSGEKTPSPSTYRPSSRATALAAQRNVSLVVNGKTTATKRSDGARHDGRATVDFPALEVPYGFSRCDTQ